MRLLQWFFGLFGITLVRSRDIQNLKKMADIEEMCNCIFSELESVKSTVTALVMTNPYIRVMDMRSMNEDSEQEELDDIDDDEFDRRRNLN